MKKVILFCLLFAIGLFLLVGVLKNIGLHHVLSVFASFPWWGVLALLILTGAGVAASVVRWQRILRWQKVDTDIWFLTRAWLVGFMTMYLTPIPRVGGAPVRAEFLHKKYGISFRQAMKSVVIDEISEATMWVLFIMVGVVFFFDRIGIPQLNKTFILAIIIFLLAVVVLVGIYAMSFKRKQVLSKIVKWFNMEKSKGGQFLQDFEEDMINFFHPKNPVLWEALALSFFKHFVDLVRNVFIIFALGGGIHWGLGIISYMMFSIGYALPVPGALGVQEAGQALTFGLLGLGPETGVVLSLLIRGADLVFVAMGAILLLHRGLEMLGIHKIVDFLLIVEEENRTP